MANLYTYEIIGVPRIRQVSLIANTQKHAEKKIVRSKLNGKKLVEFRLLSSQKFDDKFYL